MEKNKGVTVILWAENEEDIARSLESLSRPLAGLILDGMNVWISRNDVVVEEAEE